MKVLLLWLQQPTSVAGLSAAIGTISALATQQINWAQAAPLLIGAVVSILLPDNAGAKSSAESLVANIIAATTSHQEKT